MLLVHLAIYLIHLLPLLLLANDLSTLRRLSTRLHVILILLLFGMHITERGHQSHCRRTLILVLD